jgi:hypothetical protein
MRMDIYRTSLTPDDSDWELGLLEAAIPIVYLHHLRLTCEGSEPRHGWAAVRNVCLQQVPTSPRSCLNTGPPKSRPFLR